MVTQLLTLIIDVLLESPPVHSWTLRFMKELAQLA